MSEQPSFTTRYHRNMLIRAAIPLGITILGALLKFIFPATPIAPIVLTIPLTAIVFSELVLKRGCLLSGILTAVIMFIVGGILFASNNTQSYEFIGICFLIFFYYLLPFITSVWHYFRGSFRISADQVFVRGKDGKLDLSLKQVEEVESAEHSMFPYPLLPRSLTITSVKGKTVTYYDVKDDDLFQGKYQELLTKVKMKQKKSPQ